METNGRNITFRNRSGRHEKSYPGLILKVNLSRGLIKTEDQTRGPCSRTICPCCPPASVAIVRSGYPRGERSFGPTGVDTFHVISQHRLILCINIVLYFAQGMLPLYHILLLIFSDWMDPHKLLRATFLCIDERKERKRAGREERWRRRNRERAIPVFSIVTIPARYFHYSQSSPENIIEFTYKWNNHVVCS